MARLFTSTSSEFAEVASAPVTAVPLTLACWVRLTAVGVPTRVIMSVKNKASGDARNTWNLQMNGSEQVVALTGGGASSSTATYTGASLVAGTWAHIGAVFGGNASRFAYLNGAASAENTSSQTPTGVDNTTIGMQRRNTTVIEYFWNGDIAFPVVYNVALTADDFAELADSFAPPCVRPDAIVEYWPLFGNSSPEPGTFGGYNLTLTGTSKSDSPRIIEPRRSRMFSIPAAAGAGLVWRLAGGRTGRPLAGRGGLAA